MSIVSVLKRLFRPKSNVFKSDAFVPYGKQHDLIQKFSTIFNAASSNVKTVLIHSERIDSESRRIHVFMIDSDDIFINGIHIDNQGSSTLLWTEPWDENEHGEDGKARFAEVGLSFKTCTDYVDSLFCAFDEFQEAFNLGQDEQLQFNRSKYWITKR